MQVTQLSMDYAYYEYCWQRTFRTGGLVPDGEDIVLPMPIQVSLPGWSGLARYEDGAVKPGRYACRLDLPLLPGYSNTSVITFLPSAGSDPVGPFLTRDHLLPRLQQVIRLPAMVSRTPGNAALKNSSLKINLETIPQDVDLEQFREIWQRGVIEYTRFPAKRGTPTVVHSPIQAGLIKPIILTKASVATNTSALDPIPVREIPIESSLADPISKVVIPGLHRIRFASATSTADGELRIFRSPPIYLDIK